MKVADILRFAHERGEPIFSFEFLPPKTEDGIRQLLETVEALRPLGPTFASVTYGAGGSTRQRTLELVTRLKRETEIEAAAHVTCGGPLASGARARPRRDGGRWYPERPRVSR